MAVESARRRCAARCARIRRIRSGLKSAPERHAVRMGAVVRADPNSALAKTFLISVVARADSLDAAAKTIPNGVFARTSSMEALEKATPCAAIIGAAPITTLARAVSINTISAATPVDALLQSGRARCPGSRRKRRRATAKNAFIRPARSAFKGADRADRSG